MGNHGGVNVQSQRHLVPGLGRWMAGPQRRAPGRGPICAYYAVDNPAQKLDELLPRSWQSRQKREAA
jgi:hypothetical protein